MKITKKAKRISSVVLCFLMLLTTLPMTAITANAAAQAYIKYIDTEVYIGDVLKHYCGSKRRQYRRNLYLSMAGKVSEPKLG